MCAQKYRAFISVALVGLIASLVNAQQHSTTKETGEVLTLQQAITLALRDNTNVVNASLDVNKSIEDFAASRTRRLPSINFEMRGTQQLTPIDVTFERGAFGNYPGIGPIPATDTKLSTPMQPTGVFITQVTQPLTMLHRINLGLKQSELKTEIAREELRARQQQITRDVKRAYFAVLQTQSALRSVQETVKMYRELDRVTDNYLAQQVVLKTDSLDVRSRLAKSEYDAATLVDQLSTQKQQLNLLLGGGVLTEFSVAAVPEAESFELDLASARARALQARPEIREARLKLQQSELDRRIKKAEYIPDVRATFQHFATANFNSVIPRSYMNVGVTMTWEIFDWGRKRHELAENDIATAQAKNSVRDAESRVLIEVSDKYNRLRQARQFLTVVEMSRQSAMENVRVLSNRYKVQMSLLSDVLRAQAQFEEANNQKRQALLGFFTAKAEYETAIGDDIEEKAGPKPVSPAFNYNASSRVLQND